MKYIFLFSALLTCVFCKQDDTTFVQYNPDATYQDVIPGAERMRKYIPMLTDKRVAVVVNQSSIVKDKHLIDSLLDFNIQIVTIFAPEHGFRGNADAGAVIEDGKDKKTGIPIVSLYGKHKKPSKEDLADIDIVLFDIQDVGVRFYTYISTLTYVMDACAQFDKPLIVLDRPNPNGHYVDGPVLQKGFESFVGLHHVPVVYGMTIGEYAKMVNGEKWMEHKTSCDLTVIPCSNYKRSWSEGLPVHPSPNLRSHEAILLYPSLCFFEGTVVSIGRGTKTPFRLVGHPKYVDSKFSFTPQPGYGSKFPKFKNEACYGMDLTHLDATYLKAESQLNLSYLLNMYGNLKMEDKFFNTNLFFDKLAGTDQLRKQIIEGQSEEAIRASWVLDTQKFLSIRSKYLMYPA